MKKRILLLFTAFILMLNMFNANISFAQANEETKYIDLLKKLDIWVSYTSENFESQRNMYRGEYIKSVLNIVMNQKSEGVELSQSQIDHAVSLGLIADKNNVDPSLPIKMQDAIKVSVNAMGYNVLAEQYGGYPFGHLKIANRLDLLLGINASPEDYLTREEAARLIYNTALGAPLRTYAYTGNGISYSDVYGDVTMLEYYRNIIKVSGIVTATPSSNLYSEYGIDKGTIRIENKIYPTKLTNLDDLIGMRIDAYVQKNKSAREEVLHIEVDNPRETIKIYSEDIQSVSSNLRSLTYYDHNNSTKTVEINAGKAIFYNGVLYEDCTSADFQVSGGIVELIDNDKNTEGYDVVKIWVAKHILVDGISVEESLILNLITYDSSFLSLKLDEACSLIQHEGKIIEVSELKRFDLLEVFIPKNSLSKYVKVVVCRNTVSGNLESSNTDGVIINGTKYEFSPEYDKATTNGEKYAPEPQVGKNYRVFLDSCDRICAVEVDDEGIVYGLVTNVAYQNKGFQEKAYIRVLTWEDRWVEYSVSEKLQVNATPCKLSDLKLTLGNSVQMLKLDINAKGEIRNIWTATETTDIGLEGFTVKPEQKENFYSGNNSFRDNVYISANPKIFVKYTNSLLTGEDEKDYFVTDLSFLKHTYQYNFRAYNIDEYNCSELFYIELPDTYDVVLKQEVYGFLVETVEEHVDSQGNDVTKLYGGYGSSGMMILPVVDDAADGINSGDFILPVIDEQGNLKAYTKIYSLLDGEIERYPISCYERDGWVFGHINKLDIANKRCLIGTENRPYVWSAANVPVYIYYQRTGFITKTTTADMEIGDYVIMHYLRATLREIIIIK